MPASTRLTLPLLLPAALFCGGCLGGADPQSDRASEILAASADFDERDADGDRALESGEIPRDELALADRDQDGAVSHGEFLDLRMAGEEPQVPPTQPTERALDSAVQPDPANPDRTMDARKRYLTGVKLLETRPDQLNLAIQEFNRAIQADPRYYKAHFKLGICYYRNGQYDLEINEYLKCLAINPQYAPARLNLGHAYLAAEELQKARDTYQRVLDVEPGHQVALYNLALVEFDLREYGRARELFEEFLARAVDPEADSGGMGAGEWRNKADWYIQQCEDRQAKAEDPAKDLKSFSTRDSAEGSPK